MGGVIGDPSVEGDGVRVFLPTLSSFLLQLWQWLHPSGTATPPCKPLSYFSSSLPMGSSTHSDFLLPLQAQGWLVSPFAGPWLSHHILVSFIKPTHTSVNSPSIKHFQNLAEYASFLPVSRIIHEANSVYQNRLVMEKQCLYFRILHPIPISSALLCNRFTSWSWLQDQIPSLALIVGFLENLLYMIIRGSNI